MADEDDRKHRIAILDDLRDAGLLTYTIDDTRPASSRSTSPGCAARLDSSTRSDSRAKRYSSFASSARVSKQGNERRQSNRKVQKLNKIEQKQGGVAPGADGTTRAGSMPSYAGRAD